MYFAYHFGTMHRSTFSASAEFACETQTAAWLYKEFWQPLMVQLRHLKQMINVELYFKPNSSQKKHQKKVALLHCLVAQDATAALLTMQISEQVALRVLQCCS